MLIALIASQVFYALIPYSRRTYLAVLFFTALGLAIGQLWDFVELPGLRFGQVNLVPGLLFALILQTLVRFLPVGFGKGEGNRK